MLPVLKYYFLLTPTHIALTLPVTMKEAAARIKINHLLEEAGWRFFPTSDGPANVQLEPKVSIKSADLDALGNNFENKTTGYIDFLLLDDRKFPLLVLEAKAENKNPLVGKEQARKYAASQKCRFVILSNGNVHYFWDLERGNPEQITKFPRPDSVSGYKKVQPNPQLLFTEKIKDDFIVVTQRPAYASEAAYNNEQERPEYIKTNRLRFLRPYQIRAIEALQASAKRGNERFLFEMATGTGKTLTAAAVIKLFLKTGNARRVLFLVDRLELEIQAHKSFDGLLANDFKTVIYKENRDEWRSAEIVVSTVQSFLFNNKYQRLFSPTDFDLVISDEAHRSIGGNARAVFDYFIGNKLGLTATPRDFLKKVDTEKLANDDPRQLERRLMLDTYRTFGCADSYPTFRYSLLKGVEDGYLVNPTVIDARTGITTRLLSEQGYSVNVTDDTGEDQTQVFKQREFEKRFFAESTNQLLCKTFLENALKDPVTGEIGKSIIFAVSQTHASKLTQILNKMTDRMYPGKYNSDFAMQVTSQVPDAQQFTINFANNNLGGSSNFLETYKTSKTRICVTVGMMTTGYDCPDLLNIGLFRPIFSPTDFIQVKGRGTRKHNFLELLFDPERRKMISEPEKTTFKLFDFFRNCQYFEEDFKYDEVIKLPATGGGEPKPETGGGGSVRSASYTHLGDDIMATIAEQTISADGMKIDRMFFRDFEEDIKKNAAIAASVEAGDWDRVIDYVNREVFDRPDQYYTLEKLQKSAAVDRRLTLREILEKVFGLIPGFKSRDELLEEEFAKFVADQKPTEAIPALKNYFKAYASNERVRQIIENRQFTLFATNPGFSTADFKAVPPQYRTVIPSYINDYVPTSQFSH